MIAWHPVTSFTLFSPNPRPSLAATRPYSRRTRRESRSRATAGPSTGERCLPYWLWWWTIALRVAFLLSGGWLATVIIEYTSTPRPLPSCKPCRVRHFAKCSQTASHILHACLSIIVSLIWLIGVHTNHSFWVVIHGFHAFHIEWSESFAPRLSDSFEICVLYWQKGPLKGEKSQNKFFQGTLLLVQNSELYRRTTHLFVLQQSKSSVLLIVLRFWLLFLVFLLFFEIQVSMSFLGARNARGRSGRNAARQSHQTHCE